MAKLWPNLECNGDEKNKGRFFLYGVGEKRSGESPLIFLFCRSPDFGDLIAYYVTKLNGFQ